MIKNIEREIALLSKTVTQTQANITILKQQVDNMVQMCSRDLAQLTTVTYRCLSQMHNIIISTLPYIVMPPRNHEDLARMAYELLRTIYQLPIPESSEV